MTYNLRNLENHSGSGAGPKLWSYKNSSDTLATINGSNYFADAAGLVAAGDFLFVTGSDGSQVAVIASNDGTTVVLGPAGESGQLSGSATFDASSIADGDEEATEVTVTGAALGDFALASFSLDVADLVVRAAVTAANTVTVVFANNTGGAIDLASGTVSVRVLK